MTGKRELIDIGRGKRYVRRDRATTLAGHWFKTSGGKRGGG